MITVSAALLRRNAYSLCFNQTRARNARSISSSLLTIERTTDGGEKFRNRPPKEELTYGTTMSDHMLMIEWDQGWNSPKIVPYGDLQLSPAATSLHYGLACFEGMKAYKTLTDGSLRLFRPDRNAERLARSMERLEMPGYDFDQAELIDCIAELVRLDKDWIPEGEGYSLYLRPTVIATHNFLGLAPPTKVLLYVITSPIGPYYKTGFEPIRLMAESSFIRAWPGGTGNAKVGGNYAPTMKPQAHANKEGYSQVLWLFGEDETVTEVGSMNIFFFLINKETGNKELLTAPLTRGDILPGVTRESVLDMARSWGEFDVVERFATMPEIRDAVHEGRMLEAFGTGTSAVVCPVSCINYEGEDLDIPATGDVTQRVWNEITGIQYGTMEGPEGWSYKI